MTAPPPGAVPDLLVEKLRLGELAPAEAAAVRARLAAEPGGLERLAALDADDRATLARHPRLVLPPPAPARPWLRLAIPGLVAALAAVLIVARLPSSPAGPATDPLGFGPEAGLRPKGGELAPRLVVYRQTAQGYDVLSDGALARAGDVLQLAYVAAGRTYGAILSVDGRGATTTHLAAGALTQGGEVRLPTGYALDDAPDFERFVLMTLAPRTGVLEVTTVTLAKPR